uniref:Uncharacterized protein ycf33 n=1 Tax=Rhodogorgon sp. TaxID=2485824 RepID=A0A3G3MHU4_9FLOR|nr:hypothetical protein [Rhodogorgon sp.]
MHTLGDNIIKFTKFFIAVLIGFFLITFNPIFRLLKQPKNRLIITILILGLAVSLYQILRLMLGTN